MAAKKPEREAMQRTASPRGDSTDELRQVERLVQTDPSQALEVAEALLRSSRDPRLFRLAAEACRKLNLHADAVSAELAGIQAGLANRQLAQAAAQSAEGKWVEALSLAQEFLGEHPGDLLAMTIAAEAQTALWQLEEAEQTVREVLRRAPTFLRASMLLADCLSKQARVRDAVAVLEEVLVRKPNNLAVLNHLGTLRAEVRDADGSIETYRKVAALQPGRLEPLVNLAHHYRMVGQSEDAIASFRAALALDSANGSAWWGLTNYFGKEITETDEPKIRAGLTRYKGTLHEGSLHLTLGLVADRRSRHAEAFEHFEAGKKIRLAHQPFDPDPITSAVDEVIKLFSRDLYEARSTYGCADDAPIFILGMPRAGTTLVERILGRHTAVEAAGELQILKRVAERARHQVEHPEDYAAVLTELSDRGLAETGKRYVRAARDFRLSDKPHFIDKNNTNWLHLPLILLALPRAKIIDVRRGALDCCWANFKMLFGEGFPAANDLRHVGRFYSDYVRLVDAMKRVAPERILKVRYEDVVDDLEGQTRRMLRFLALPFETACLDFHLSTEAVATASSEQVRQPINRKGIGSSEPYRQWLGPLIEALGPLADE